MKVYLKSHENVGFMKIRCHNTSNLEDADKISDKALAEVVCHTVNRCTNGEYYTVEEIENGILEM